MKDIDFIPSSYHLDRQRRIWFRQRYTTVILALVVWSLGTLVAGRFVSRAHGELASLQGAYEQGLRKVELADTLELRLSELTQKDGVLDRLCPRTNVSAVLSELSARVGERVLLTDVRLVQTPIQADAGERQGGSSGTVRLGAGGGGRAGTVLPQEPMCTTVILTGVAADAEEVANLISRLEESDYFARVSPGFSRNKELQERNVTEFEVQCIVSDFAVDR